MRRYISLLLFIGLVFCQNSGANKVELSEPELSNIASESIKKSMKKSKKKSKKGDQEQMLQIPLGSVPRQCTELQRGPDRLYESER